MNTSGIQILEDVKKQCGAAKLQKIIIRLVDINFGCPVYKVVNKGAGAACLRDLGMMERMAGTVVDGQTKPVTVKTRLGWDDSTIKIQEVALMLQRIGVKALTVHANFAKKYKGEARWVG